MIKLKIITVLVSCATGLVLTRIPPMPDIDQISTDEEWAAMMEEYEAVQALRAAMLRGEVVLDDTPIAPAAQVVEMQAPVAAAVAAPVAYAAPVQQPAAAAVSGSIAAAPLQYAPPAAALALAGLPPAAPAMALAAPMAPAYVPAAAPVAVVAPAAVAAPVAYAPAPVAAVAAPEAGAPIVAREAAVGNKVDALMNASSDEEWEKMMDSYNKALQANPVQ